jgi:dTDP-4-amino-4,6-dideoxygalactose transaminase
MNIAREYRLKVIEDAAQAIGTTYKNGLHAGTFGDVGCFSFFPSKI